MGQHQEDVENLEPDRGNRKEIDRGELRDVVFKESTPSLRRRFPAAHHVLADGVLQKYTDKEVNDLINRKRAVQSMRVDPSGSVFRSRSQTTSKLLRSRAVGGERWRKSAGKLVQVGIRETNESEPLRTRR